MCLKIEPGLCFGIKESNLYGLSLIAPVISLLLLIGSCISNFEPDIDGEYGMLVVDGSIIKGAEIQVIRISKTTPISKPVYIPVENCHVIVRDSTGNEFDFNEESPGNYIAIIDDELLQYDMKYKLIFTVPSGDVYESAFQQILKTAPVDSFYCADEYHYSPATNSESIKGIQFYTDLNAPADDSRYYRWVLEETWEHRSESEIWGVYDGQSIRSFHPSDSLYRCWQSKDVSGLYSASTMLLSENRIKKIPLHFVESSSYKLLVRYCATVKQYALNKDAYVYWYQKQVELEESGGIYTIQPFQPKSNISNMNDPDELVLGFFWASSCALKRVFVKRSPLAEPLGINCADIGVYIDSKDYYEIINILNKNFLDFASIIPDPPVYITLHDNTQYDIVLKPACVDCRIAGGDNKKPDFWTE